MKTAMKIDVKESTFMCPAQDTPNESMWLSDFDLLQPRFHIFSLYFYQPNQADGGGRDISAIEVIQTLKESLSKVLVPFYPVAGRLGRDETGRIEIKCNGKGALFSVAETDSTVDDLHDGGFTTEAELAKLFPGVDYSFDISSCPLGIIQVTFFKCGGICLGVGLSHAVHDGQSAGRFVSSWACIARGIPIDPPFHDRTITRDRAQPSPKFPHHEFDLNPQLQHSTKDKCRAQLSISLDQLKTLKAEANINGDQNYSSYEVLVAHIWRCACKARGLADDQTTRVYLPVDCRSRLNPPLPQLFFGNAVLLTSPMAPAGDVLKEGLSATAERIHKAIKGMDDEYIRSSLADVHQNLEAVEEIIGKPIYQNPNLSLMSWTRMPLHDLDFGWGPPAYVIPVTFSEGVGFIMSSAAGDGGLSLHLCLETDHMQAFRELFYELCA